jgi:hypothetical protein
MAVSPDADSLKVPKTGAIRQVKDDEEDQQSSEQDPSPMKTRRTYVSWMV